MPIPPTPKSPPILVSDGHGIEGHGYILRHGGHAIIIADALESTPVAQAGTGAFRALGYRQTVLPASQGGTTNRKGIRVRNGAMRALARSFRSTPFLMNHDWSDIRARGGTITDAWAEEISDATEIAIFYDVLATVPWALEGVANKTIDRFSFGIGRGGGEIHCTVHGAPVWTDDCYCWPGETVDGLVAEWEWQDPEGLELSAVNVPAVRGTSIVKADAGSTTEAARVAELAEICGREHRARPRAVTGAPKGGFPVARPPITMAPHRDPQRGNQMDRALICKSLGLPVTATDAEITARAELLGTEAAVAGTLRAQLGEVAQRELTRAAADDAAHVEAEISRLTATRIVGEPVIASVRASAKSGRAAFDASLKLVEDSAPPKPPGIGAAPIARATLQSDGKPAEAPGGAGAGAVELDAYDVHKNNPHLLSYMKRCGLSVDDVRKHGSATVNVVPKLGDLIAATHARGA